MLDSITNGAEHLNKEKQQHLVVCEGIDWFVIAPYLFMIPLSTTGMIILTSPNPRLTIAMDGDEANHKAGFNLEKHAYSKDFETFMR